MRGRDLSAREGDLEILARGLPLVDERLQSTKLIMDHSRVNCAREERLKMAEEREIRA